MHNPKKVSHILAFVWKPSNSIFRLILHESVYDEVLEKLKKSYASIMTRKGDPLDDGTLYGPLHSQAGVDGYLKTLNDAKKAGGKVVFGGNLIEGAGNYVEPTIITDLPHDAEVVHRSSFLDDFHLRISLT